MCLFTPRNKLSTKLRKTPLLPHCCTLTPAHLLQPGYALKLSLPAGDRNLDDKLDVVEQEGMGPTQTHVLTPGGAPSEAMMGFLRLIQLQGRLTVCVCVCLCTCVCVCLLRFECRSEVCPQYGCAVRLIDGQSSVGLFWADLLNTCYSY